MMRVSFTFLWLVVAVGVNRSCALLGPLWPLGEGVGRDARERVNRREAAPLSLLPLGDGVMGICHIRLKAQSPLQ